jgi:hypothetical protein
MWPSYSPRLRRFIDSSRGFPQAPFSQEWSSFWPLAHVLCLLIYINVRKQYICCYAWLLLLSLLFIRCFCAVNWGFSGSVVSSQSGGPFISCLNFDFDFSAYLYCQLRGSIFTLNGAKVKLLPSSFPSAKWDWAKTSFLDEKFHLRFLSSSMFVSKSL